MWENGAFFISLAKKTMSWRSVGVVVLLASACGMADLGRSEHADSDGIWTGPGISDPESVCYVTAFDYRDGYDWKSDPEKGTVKCSVVLFAGTKPVLKVPVGDMYEMSSDSRRHRVINGVLYSDYTDGQTTVVKRNGEELYRYEGAETVEKMLLHEGSVHTLCIPAEGSGFSYRIDGCPVMTRSSGTFFDHLVSYRDTVSFCFSHPVNSAEGPAEGYYVARNGTVERIWPGDVFKVWDLCPLDGCIGMIMTVSEGEAPVMVCGEERNVVNYFRILDIVYCRFIDSERVFANLRCRLSGYMTDFYWTGDGDWDTYRFTETLSCLYADENRTYAVKNLSDEEEGLIFYGRRAITMPPDYYAGNRNCMAVIGEVQYVGLTSSVRGRPLLWSNLRTDTLNVNGYISSVSRY